MFRSNVRRNAARKTFRTTTRTPSATRGIAYCPFASRRNAILPDAPNKAFYRAFRVEGNCTGCHAHQSATSNGSITSRTKSWTRDFMMRLHNDWSDADYDGFLRHPGNIIVMSDKHGGRQSRTEFEYQPALRSITTDMGPAWHEKGPESCLGRKLRHRK